MKKNSYGLLTCITMIIGVVVGSGIFFKSDNILMATGGNIFLGVLAFCIAAISIIFGSLTVAELAARNDSPGGVISYCNDSYNGGVACAFGWFHTFLYYPTLITVVCYIAGSYTAILFGIKDTLELQLLIGLGLLLSLFSMNLLSAKLGACFQSASTIIKLVPLILMGALGLVFGNPSEAIAFSPTEVKSTGWLTALIPIVFAFDGWIVATTISHKVKNAKKNVPLALVSAPILILAIYLLYFIGISVFLGPDTIIQSGDTHVYLVAEKFFGPWGAKLLLVCIIISVSGTANGLMIGLLQLPYSLALRNMFPYSKKVSEVNERWDTPLISSIIGFSILIFWFVVHYITQKSNLLPNSDISEVPLTLNYLAFILLYVQVLRYGFKGEIKSLWRGKLNPIFAICGSLVILGVGMQNPSFWPYVFLCTLLIITGWIFWKKKQHC